MQRSRRSITVVSLLLALAPGSALAQRFGLIARGGEALRLVRHDLELSITHPIVETVVTQEFENRESVSLEGTFHYPVPPGATVIGLALWVGETRREARMLERQKAREIYDGIVREKRDPALLERVDGGFRIRIFPVLPRSRTRVELRFVEPVQAVAPGRYQVVVRRPPGEPIHVLRLGVRLRASFPIAEASLHGLEGSLLREGAELVLSLGATRRSFARDLELRYRRATPPAPLALSVRHEGRELLLAELPLGAAPGGVPRRWALLIDGSRSMAPHLEVARKLAARFLAELPARDQLAVASFDLLPREGIVPRVLDRGGRAEASRRIAALRAEGGSALVPGFIRALASGVDAIVYITDGATRYHQEELEQLLRISVDNPGVKISALLAVGGANEEGFSDLAAASGGLLERFDEATDAVAAVRRIAARAPEPRVEGPVPFQLVHRDPFRVLVAASLPPELVGRPLRLRLQGVVEELQAPRDQASAARGVRGLVASAAIEGLMRRVKTLGETPELRAGVIALSRAHNVVSEYTALLATETDADYQRPTSGQAWQRMTPRVGDDLPSPSFQSTPEPHEWAMIGIGLLLLFAMRRRQLRSRARPI